MSVTYGFYNSVAGDRVYDAVQVSQMFDGILTDGIFKMVGNQFLVIPNTGMQIIVRSGKAWFNHTWTYNDSDMGLTVSNSDLVLPRIDSVILEVNAAIGSRVNTIKMLNGTPNASPVPPTLTNTAELHQYALAYISVAAAASSIVSGDISQLVGTVGTPFVVFPEPIADGSNAADVLKVQIFT